MREKVKRKKKEVPESIHYRMWARIHNLEIQENPCSKCGLILKTTIPFSIPGWIGLKSEAHACSPDYDLMIVAPDNEKERKKAIAMYEELRAALEC